MKLKCAACGRETKFQKIYSGAETEEIGFDEYHQQPYFLEHYFDFFVCTRCFAPLRQERELHCNGQLAERLSDSIWFTTRNLLDEVNDFTAEIQKSSNQDFARRTMRAIKCAECGFYAEAMMALRAAFEVLVIDGKEDRRQRGVSFPGKISAFASDRNFGERNFGERYTENANSLLEAGHGAIHRDWEPKRDDFIDATKLLGAIVREVNLFEASQTIDAETSAARSNLAGKIPPAT